ncbi:MAG: hypothetical protein LBC61_00915 [Candidatus Peribacteria bacterium]|nr:hypothetical protein [Candidatus Peribacteria bacterium]
MKSLIFCDERAFVQAGLMLLVHIVVSFIFSHSFHTSFTDSESFTSEV